MSDISVNLEPSRKASANRVETPPDFANSQSGEKVLDSEGLALMRRLGSGDESALTELIELHGQMLARLVGRLTAWNSDHEDVFQEVLLQIWQKANSYRGTGPLEGWLRRLAVNRCRNHLRRQNSFRKLLANWFEQNRKQVTDATADEPSSKIQNALAELSLNERTVLVLYYLEEMSGAEAATALGIKTESFHVRLHRARRKLKSVLVAKGES